MAYLYLCLAYIYLCWAYLGALRAVCMFFVFNEMATSIRARAGVQDREVLQLLAANGLDPHAMEHVHKQPLWALALDRGWTRSELALLFHDL